MNTTNAACNPHDAPIWPFDIVADHRLAEAVQALSGAEVLTRLLHQNSLLVAMKRDSDRPEDEPAPFNENTVAGLQSALATCISCAHAAVETLAWDKAVESKGRE